jgi:hypothetical protein
MLVLERYKSVVPTRRAKKTTIKVKINTVLKFLLKLLSSKE